jgi:5-methylcytosine-specific restriction endonuclease McrA
MMLVRLGLSEPKLSMSYHYFKFKLFGQMLGIRWGCKAERFSTRQEAEARKSGDLKVHFCEFCEGFHLYVRSLSMKERVILDQQGKCARCHVEYGQELTVHHILPKSQGGRNSRENLVALCFDCHCAEHGTIPYRRKRGVLVKREKRKIVREFVAAKRWQPAMTNEEFRKMMLGKWGKAPGLFGEKLTEAIKTSDKIQ